MLERIREGSQGPAAKVILGLVILSFALAGIGGYLGQTTEQPVAEVNGVKISQLEFTRAFENERARLEQQFGEYFNQIASDPAYMAQIRKGVVDRLVQQELQNQLASELGLRVSDEQLKKAIIEMPYFQSGGEFSNDRYLQLIRQMNFQPDSFREYLREEMTRSQLVSAVAGSDFILSNELNRAITLQQQTRSLDFVTLDKESVKEQVKIEDQEIKEYYELNQNKYMTSEQVSVEYVELKTADIELTKAITDDEVLAYYTESQAQYLEPEKRRVSHILVESLEDASSAKVKAETILAELKSGADFEKLAQERSDDTVSAELGGDLDWIELDMMDPEFEKAAFALENVGDYTEVVESEFGYHVIKLTDIQRQEVKEFDDVKADLKAELENNAKVDLFYEKQTEIADVAFEVSDSLEDAALVGAVEVKNTGLIDRLALPAPLNNPVVTSVLFSPELLEDKVNSEVLEVGNEHIVVVRVKEYAPAKTKSLEEVSDQVKAVLIDEKASILIVEQAQSLYDELKSGLSLQSLAERQSLEVTSKSELTRQSYDIAPAIVKEAFKLAHPAQGNAEVAMVELNNGNAALVQLNSVKTPELSTEVDPQQKQNITMSQVNKNYLAFIASLEAKSEVNRPVLTVSQDNL